MTLHTGGSALGAISTRSRFWSSATRWASLMPKSPSWEPSTPMRRQVLAVISPLMRGPSFLAIVYTFPSMWPQTTALGHRKLLVHQQASRRRHPHGAESTRCLTRQLPRRRIGGDIRSAPLCGTGRMVRFCARGCNRSRTYLTAPLPCRQKPHNSRARKTAGGCPAAIAFPGARSGGRTHTLVFQLRILSPPRLPIPPSGRGTYAL